MFKKEIIIISVSLFFFGAIDASAGFDLIVEKDSYKVKLWREVCAEKIITYVSGSQGKDTFNCGYADFFKNNTEVKDEVNLDPEVQIQKNYNVAEIRVAINDNKKVFFAFKRSVSLALQQVYGVIYNTDGEISSSGTMTSPVLLASDDVYSAIEVMSVGNNFFYFYRRQAKQTYTENGKLGQKWDDGLYYRMFNDVGGVVKGETAIDMVSGDLLKNNIQLRYIYVSDFGGTTNTKVINNSQIAIGWYEDNHKDKIYKKYVRLINSDGSFAGAKVEVQDFSFSQFVGNNNSGGIADLGDISDGSLIRAVGDIDVYIVKYVGTKKFKRLILSPHVFESYAHFDKNGNGNKWDDVLNVEQSLIDTFEASDLIKAAGDERVYKLYPSGDNGQKRWVKTRSVFALLGYDSDAIYEINQTDRDAYLAGADIQ